MELKQKTRALLWMLWTFFGLLPLGAPAAPQYGEAALVAEWSYGSNPTPPTPVPATDGENADSATLRNWKNADMTYSSSSLAVSGWTGDGDKYWLLSFSSKNFENLTLSLSQRSSGTGPRDFQLQYSVDGNQWNNIANTSVTSSNLTTTFNNLPLPAEMNDLEQAYLRLLLVSNLSSRAGTGAYAPTESIASGGISNINNISIIGRYVGESGPTTEKTAPVAANPPTGAVELNTLVALSSNTQDALISYSLNGSGYVPYTEPFALPSLPAAVSAYAHKEGMDDSDISTFVYTLKKTVVPFEEYYPYFGQLHAHTSNSDGTGSFEQAYAMARDLAGLDFFAVTDHSNYFDNASNLGHMSTGGGINERWATGLEVAEAFNADGAFVALLGFEMTWSNRAYGHMNTFNTLGYVSTNNPVYNAAGGVGLRAYYNLLAQYPSSISMFNHPGTTFGDFSNFAYRTAAADKAICLIEVGNGEGSNQQLNRGYWRSDEYYDNALAKGWHLAPTNNQDNHTASWGTSNKHRVVALAKELNRENIYDALSNRRVYASEDDNFRLDYTLNGMPMGTIFEETPDSLEFSIRLADPDEGVGMVYIVSKNGVVLDSKYVAEQAYVWTFTLPPEYEFYYVKVVQDDGDRILSAPIWIRDVEIEEVGISGLTVAAGPHYVGSPVQTTLEIFNNANRILTVNNIRYMLDETLVKSVDNPGYVNAESVLSYANTVIPSSEGQQTLRVVVTTDRGVFEKSATFNAFDAANMPVVVVDAAHSNAYVNGDYANNIRALGASALNNGIQLKQADVLDADALQNAKGLVINPPQRTMEYVFREEELSALRAYAEAGGNFIISGRADYGDPTNDAQTSRMINSVLAAIGATTRINDDEVVWNNNTTFQFVTDNYNRNHPLLKNLELSRGMRFYSGASLIINADRVADGTVLPMLNALDGCLSFDSDGQNDATPAGSGRNMSLLVSEKLPGGGTAYISGSVFMSDFESAYDNPLLAEAMLKAMVAPKQLVTPIAEVRRAPMSERFTVEATVTTATFGAQPHSYFAYTMYVQDETGGIALYPIHSEPFEVGQKVRVTGSLGVYEGELQLVMEEVSRDVTLLDGTLNPRDPLPLSTADSMDAAYQGLLVSTQGTVTRVVSADGVIGDIYLQDESGVEAHILINGYIGYSGDGAEVEDFVKVGAEISVVGIASEGLDGLRLRVRDRSEIRLGKSEAPGGEEPGTGEPGGEASGGEASGGGVSEGEEPGGEEPGGGVSGEEPLHVKKPHAGCSSASGAPLAMLALVFWGLARRRRVRG